MTTFGNPNARTFDRQNLRWATYGDTKIQVHRLIWPMVDRILIGLDQAGIPVDAVVETDDPQKLGFFLPTKDAEAADLVQDLISPALFRYSPHSGKVFFHGTADEAVALRDALAADPEPPLAEEAPQEPQTPKESQSDPFAWEATPGSPEMRFILALIGLPTDAEWDIHAQHALRAWQTRNGMPEPTGELDTETWRIIIPRRPGWMRPGATGLQVKVMQAAFIAHGFMKSNITGVWGVEMSHALRLVQQAYDIHPRLRIGNPEWDALFQKRP